MIRAPFPWEGRTFTFSLASIRRRINKASAEIALAETLYDERPDVEMLVEEAKWSVKESIKILKRGRLHDTLFILGGAGDMLQDIYKLLAVGSA